MNFNIDYTGNKFASISRIVDGWNYIERKYSIWKKFPSCTLIFRSNILSFRLFYQNIFILLKIYYTRFFVHANIKNYTSWSLIELEQTDFDLQVNYLSISATIPDGIVKKGKRIFGRNVIRGRRGIVWKVSEHLLVRLSKEILWKNGRFYPLADTIQRSQ